MNAISKSKLVNSDKCLLVSLGSALKAGPISKTLSRLEAINICLYSCGLCVRNAQSSKYLTGNKLAPPSAPAAAIFGVSTSTNPLLYIDSLRPLKNRLLNANTALILSCLISRNLLSSLVSIPDSIFPETSSGSGTSAMLSISSFSGNSSHPFLAFSLSFTTPSTLTTDSFVSFGNSSRISLATFFLGTTT